MCRLESLEASASFSISIVVICVSKDRDTLAKGLPELQEATERQGLHRYHVDSAMKRKDAMALQKRSLYDEFVRRPLN